MKRKLLRLLGIIFVMSMLSVTREFTLVAYATEEYALHFWLVGLGFNFNFPKNVIEETP
jgi:hypothetical protein